jgi:hypothetical protein
MPICATDIDCNENIMVKYHIEYLETKIENVKLVYASHMICNCHFKEKTES